MASAGRASIFPTMGVGHCTVKARPMATIRLLIVDDDTDFRTTLRNLLAQHQEVVIVGEAADGEEALRHARLVERVLGKEGSQAAAKVAGLFLAAFGVSLIRRGLPDFLGR